MKNINETSFIVKRSFKRKLLQFVLLTCFLSLLMYSLLGVILLQKYYKDKTLSNIISQGDLIALNSMAALMWSSGAGSPMPAAWL